MTNNPKILDVGLTFDDVLLVPAKSNVMPRDVSVKTKLTRNIDLNIPLVSAAMDTVTEAELAIALAQEGGIGILHKNMSIERQALEVDKVKRSESGMIINPVTLPKTAKVDDALALMKRYRISGIPIVEGKRLVGILTNRDLRFGVDPTLPVSELMAKGNLVTAPVGTTLDESEKILHEHRIEKLLIVDDQFNLKGLITVKDIQKKKNFPIACKDDHGRLRVGAAVGVGDETMDRVAALSDSGVDVIVVDTAHGQSMGVLKTVEKVRAEYPDMQLIAGNVATGDATEDLINIGVDAVKVGIGPGSICTTRVIAGVGVPQITAILNCVAVAQKYEIPIIADGGIKQTGEIAKAIAAGASSVMIGSLFAGLEESPGETILFEGRSYKVYRAMGSISAMKEGSADRYFQKKEQKKLVPEGIEGRVPYRGKLSDSVFQFIGGLRASMGYCGAGNIDEMRAKTQFIRMTAAGLRESHPHDVIITKEAPNYQGS
jgi:IMP dehydrogenase